MKTLPTIGKTSDSKARQKINLLQRKITHAPFSAILFFNRKKKYVMGYLILRFLRLKKENSLLYFVFCFVEKIDKDFLTDNIFERNCLRGTNKNASSGEKNTPDFL